MSVRHPVDRQDKPNKLGRAASEKDLKWADNALQHIFVGQPAYPPHFCGEDINWNSRPVPDNEWVWQLNRMYFWDAMARAYWHTGEEKYAREWGRQLIDWTRKNPNDEAHHYAWRSIEAGIRGYRWSALFQYFIDSPAFTPEVLIAFLNSCYDHASYLMTKYSSGSNWGLMEAEGMAFIAITFPEFADAKTWRDEAFQRLNQEIDHQVYPDGHQRELAMGYHIGCIQWFIRTFELAKLNELTTAFPASYLEKIEKMCAVPMKLCLPDGTNVQFGDAWAGQAGQHRKRFETWAALFERDDFLFLATDGSRGTAPEATAYALPESGLYSMRSGWDKEAICLVLKCGPDGGGHCQPDNGTFDLYAGGRNLMPDGGSYIYHGNPEGRAWFRQTSVHQTLTLNGENTQYAPKQLLWTPGEDLDILVVENQSYEDLTHRRAVFFVDKRYFIIVDHAFGTATGDVDIHFQLAPGGMRFLPGQLEASSDFSEGWNVLVKAIETEGLQMQEEEGQVSFVYTEKEARPAFRYRQQKRSEATRFVTLVMPYEDQVADVQVKVIDTPVGALHSLKLEITEGNKTMQIGYELK
jgi:heparan-sulfate lyase